MTDSHSPRQELAFHPLDKVAPLATGGLPIQVQVGKRSTWIIEWLFYGHLIIGSFVHLLMNIEFVAPVLLGVATSLAILKSPGSLRLAGLPAMIILTMLLIDLLGYPEGIITTKLYIVWFLVFTFNLAFHENPKYFLRGKIFLLFYIIAHFFFLAPFEEDPSRMGLRDDMTMANPNDLANWCIFGVMASLAEILRRKGLLRILYIGVAVAACIVLLLTVSRSAVMFLIIGTVVLVSLNAKQLGGFGPMLALLVLVAMVAGIILFFEPDAINLFQGRVDSEEGNYSGRTYLYDEAIKVFLESPWLGTGKDKVIPPLHSIANVPHNQYLGLAVHYGIWPVIFFILFFIQLTVKSVSLLMSKQGADSYSLATELFVFLLFMFLTSMVSNVMLLSTFFAFYMAKILVYKPT